MPLKDCITSGGLTMDTAVLEWFEPWEACDPEGGVIDAHTTIRASVKDCINLQRFRNKKAGRSITENDEILLNEFIIQHFAIFVDAPKSNGG